MQQQGRSCGPATMSRRMSACSCGSESATLPRAVQVFQTPGVSLPGVDRQLCQSCASPEQPRQLAGYCCQRSLHWAHASGGRAGHRAAAVVRDSSGCKGCSHYKTTFIVSNCRRARAPMCATMQFANLTVCLPGTQSSRTRAEKAVRCRAAAASAAQCFEHARSCSRCACSVVSGSCCNASPWPLSCKVRSCKLLRPLDGSVTAGRLFRIDFLLTMLNCGSSESHMLVKR